MGRRKTYNRPKGSTSDEENSSDIEVLEFETIEANKFQRKGFADPIIDMDSDSEIELLEYVDVVEGDEPSKSPKQEEKSDAISDDEVDNSTSAEPVSGEPLEDISDETQLKIQISSVPIILQTNNFPYLLVPLTSKASALLPSKYDDALTLFDDDFKTDSTIYEVFEQIRSTFKELDNAFSDEDDLFLTFKEFDLALSESSVYCHQLTLVDVLNTFLSLRRNSADEETTCLHLELGSQKSFISQFENIRNLKSTGKEKPEEEIEIGQSPVNVSEAEAIDITDEDILDDSVELLQGDAQESALERGSNSSETNHTVYLADNENNDDNQDKTDQQEEKIEVNPQQNAKNDVDLDDGHEGIEEDSVDKDEYEDALGDNEKPLLGFELDRSALEKISRSFIDGEKEESTGPDVAIGNEVIEVEIEDTIGAEPAGEDVATKTAIDRVNVEAEIPTEADIRSEASREEEVEEAVKEADVKENGEVEAESAISFAKPADDVIGSPDTSTKRSFEEAVAAEEEEAGDDGPDLKKAYLTAGDEL
jgi:hypothetical protein